MRNVSRILASGIVIAAVGSLVAASDDNPFDPQSPPPAPPQATTAVTTPSGPAMPGAPGVSLTDPISTSAKPAAFDPFANEPASAASKGHSSSSMRQGPANH